MTSGRGSGARLPLKMPKGGVGVFLFESGRFLRPVHTVHLAQY